MHIPSMVVDLAIMLMTAAVVTVVFRKIKLPVILGYIVAGFLISPYFPLFFDVSNQKSIDLWSEIGVVIILFHIGLEFDFHRIAKIGNTAVITAVVKMTGVMVVGYFFGLLIGLPKMSSVFLGAMLSISSTVVITKCLEELGLQKQKYASLVMGELVMEDVFSIAIMVVLSTVSVSKSVNGGELTLHMALMVVYLIFWLLLGIFIIPTFMNRISGMLTKETLVVLSLGMCFFMALIGNKLGFSMELGAFLAGSIFAGTSYVHEIEEATAGTKDLFGAIYFLSVGMMVNPHVIAEKWMIILPIAIVAVIAKFIFTPIGMILSGQNLTTAIKGGISLAPIGEFSFIIANLGVSLGVMKGYLYPVIVAASIITIVISPTMMRHSDKAVATIERMIPKKLRKTIENYTSDNQDEKEKTNEWGVVLKNFFINVVIYGSIMLVTVLLCMKFLDPNLGKIMNEIPAHIFTILVIYAVMAIFLRPLLDFHSVSFTYLWFDSKANRAPLIVLVILRIAIVLIIAYIPMRVFFHVHELIFMVLGVFIVIGINKFDFISTSYLQLETMFLRNLNEKTLNNASDGVSGKHWLDEDYSIFSFIVPKDAKYAGNTLLTLGWGRRLNIYVVKIEKFRDHGKKSLLLPSGNTRIEAGDKLYVVGDDRSLVTFNNTLGMEQDKKFRTLKEFMATDFPDTENALSCVALQVKEDEPFAGKTIRNSNIQKKYHCLILGIDKDGYAITMPDANMMITTGDILWVMGSNKNVGKMAALGTTNDSCPVIYK